jgi:hypothetical protein
MTNKAKSLTAPVLIITLGLGWLLTVNNLMPGVNWIWVLGLAVIGFLVLAVGGIDKVTFVVGPFLVASTFFSLLRQTGRISVDTEVPTLVIVFGVLMLLAKLLPIPIPKWIIEPGDGNATKHDAGKVEPPLDRAVSA